MGERERGRDRETERGREEGEREGERERWMTSNRIVPDISPACKKEGKGIVRRQGRHSVLVPR